MHSPWSIEQEPEPEPATEPGDDSRIAGRPGRPPRPGRPGLAVSLKGRALRYLAAREHSRVELERKLASHEETPGQLAQVLDELQAKDFISESRVVESVINRRASRMGAARIRQELQSKGVDGELVSQAVAGLQATEHERALEIWRRRFGERSADQKERARQMRFLMARGFSSSVVASILKGGHDDE